MNDTLAALALALLIAAGAFFALQSIHAGPESPILRGMEQAVAEQAGADKQAERDCLMERCIAYLQRYGAAEIAEIKDEDILRLARAVRRSTGLDLRAELEQMIHEAARQPMPEQPQPQEGDQAEPDSLPTDEKDAR